MTTKNITDQRVETTTTKSNQKPDECSTTDNSPQNMHKNKNTKLVKTLKQFGPNTDLTAPRREWHVSLPKFIQPFVGKYMADERDWPIVHMLFNASVWIWGGSASIW